MPFAKFLYDKAHEIWCSQGLPSCEAEWKDLGPQEKKFWEDYAKAVSAYLVP